MKTIAFYLPQFHEIPENNIWWGDGFTEWTNVKKSKSQFEGHYQPRVPQSNNYYDLLNTETMEKQIELAKEFGLYGFCFYHYWFKDGKKLLEKPIENFLEHPELKFPFCLSWANEPWSRRWDGKESEVLMPQEYGEREEWIDHFNYLLDFFKDERYITVDNKPIFIIYKPELIPNLDSMLELWNIMAIENGLDGISFGFQHFTYHFMREEQSEKFDFGIEFEPSFSTRIHNQDIKNYLSFENNLLKNHLKVKFNQLKDRIGLESKQIENGVTVYDYDKIVKISTEHKPLDNKAIPCAFTGWDNTPRRGANGAVYQGSTPNKFEDYLTKQITRAKKNKQEMIFINAWNEWAEGAYLEPDEKYGTEYLQALKNALTNEENIKG